MAQVCIDGKTLRGIGPKPLHIVSAVASAQGLSPAQVAGQGKGQELGAVPGFLALLDVRRCLVSLDALYCGPDCGPAQRLSAGHQVIKPDRWPRLLALVQVQTTRYPHAGPPQPQPIRYYLSSRASLSPAQA